MHYSEWHRVNIPLSDFFREVMVHGRKIKISVSPYEIPDAFRAGYDADTHTAVLQFKYINPEPDTTLYKLPNDLQFSLGARSGRLYSIAFKVANPARPVPPEEMRERLQQVIDTMGSITAGRQRNSEMVASAISSHIDNMDLAY